MNKYWYGTCLIVMLMGSEAFAQGKGNGQGRGLKNKFLNKKHSGPPDHAGPRNVPGMGPPGLNKKVKASHSAMSWEQRRNQIMQKMEARATKLESKLGTQQAALESPPYEQSWADRREIILAKLIAKQAELDAKIKLDREILAEKRRIAELNSIENKPLVDGPVTIPSEGQTSSNFAHEVSNIDLNKHNLPSNTEPLVGPQHTGHGSSGVPGFHINDLPVIDLANTRDPWAQIGDGMGVPAMMVPLPSGQTKTGNPSGIASEGVPLGPVGGTGTSVDRTSGASREVPGTPVSGGVPLGTSDGDGWFDPSLGSGQAAVFQDIDISKFISTGEVKAIERDPATPSVAEPQGIRTVGGSVLPMIERPKSVPNIGSTKKSGSSLLGFVSGISRALKNNG